MNLINIKTKIYKISPYFTISIFIKLISNYLFFMQINCYDIIKLYIFTNISINLTFLYNL